MPVVKVLRFRSIELNSKAMGRRKGLQQFRPGKHQLPMGQSNTIFMSAAGELFFGKASPQVFVHCVLLAAHDVVAQNQVFVRDLDWLAAGRASSRCPPLARLENPESRRQARISRWGDGAK